MKGYCRKRCNVSKMFCHEVGSWKVFVSGKRKDARPKHFKLSKTVNSYGTKLSKKYNNCSLQNCFKNSL